ncbi:MAG: hypothetical protein ACK5E4_11220, partial [Planctomycetia bacterium]
PSPLKNVIAASLPLASDPKTGEGNWPRERKHFLVLIRYDHIDLFLRIYSPNTGNHTRGFSKLFAYNPQPFANLYNFTAAC